LKIGHVKALLDPYEWLPGYGESRVSLRSDGADAILEVEYEKERPPGSKREAPQLCRREIAFQSAAYFFKFPFPGADPFKIEGTAVKIALGSLTELVDSDFVKECRRVWREVSGHEAPPFRHFYIQFLSENVGFHVVAENFRLSDELPVDPTTRK
jgi:hypothetical protein